MLSSFDIVSGPPSNKFNKFIQALGGLDAVVIGGYYNSPAADYYSDSDDNNNGSNNGSNNDSNNGGTVIGGADYGASDVEPKLRKMIDRLRKNDKTGGEDIDVTTDTADANDDYHIDDVSSNSGNSSMPPDNIMPPYEAGDADFSIEYNASTNDAGYDIVSLLAVGGSDVNDVNDVNDISDVSTTNTNTTELDDAEVLYPYRSDDDITDLFVLNK